MGAMRHGLPAIAVVAVLFACGAIGLSATGYSSAHWSVDRSSSITGTIYRSPTKNCARSSSDGKLHCNVHGCETESGTELKSCSNFKLARHSGTAGVALSVLALILHISFAGCAPSMQAAVAAAAVSVAAAISIIIALTSWAEFVKEGLKPEYPDIKNADAITMEIVAIIAHFLTLPCVYFAAKALTPNTDYVVIHNSASVRLTTAQQDSYMLQPQQHMQQQPYPPQAYPGQPPQQYYPPQYPTQPPHGTYVPPNVPLSTDGK